MSTEPRSAEQELEAGEVLDASCKFRAALESTTKAVANRVSTRNGNRPFREALQGSWRLADFGVARYADSTTASDTQKLWRITTAGHASVRSVGLPPDSQTPLQSRQWVLYRAVVTRIGSAVL